MFCFYSFFAITFCGEIKLCKTRAQRLLGWPTVARPEWETVYNLAEIFVAEPLVSERHLASSQILRR